MPAVNNGVAEMTANSLYVSNIFIPGSISFNSVYILVSAAGTTARTGSFSFGLYSLNGSTLSLANSASRSFNFVNAFSWITLITSATQDITPGNWYFARLFGSSSQSSYFFFGGGHLGQASAHSGPLIYGVYSDSTTGFPASIATSEFTKTTTQATGTFGTMIIISA